MTRHLARLADIAYRRRGRMILAWIAATILLIGVGSSLRTSRGPSPATIASQGPTAVSRRCSATSDDDETSPLARFG